MNSGAGDDNGLVGGDGVGVGNAVELGEVGSGGAEVGRDVVEGVSADDVVPAHSGVGRVVSATTLGLGQTSEGGDGVEDDGRGLHYDSS